MKKIRKEKMDLGQFLCGVPARDYVFQNTPYKQQIESAVNLIKDSDIILVGAGAGASTAAGLTYSGQRFTDNFGEFIKKYGAMYMTDMYAAGFYPFPSQEAKWGYWSKHSMINRFLPPALPLYKQLFELVKNKDYFVLTTNVDHQFQKAGFDSDRIFATQGDYGEIQCEKGCHHKIYDAEKLFRKMDQARKDCRIPSDMVPKCPVCGGNMTMHLRCDRYFVEDESWYEAAGRYADFVENIEDKKGVLLELGVGFNTPAIIRFPFENMVRENRNLSLIRLNLNEAVVPESFGNRAVGINADMASTVSDICHELEKKVDDSVDILLNKLKEDSSAYKNLETGNYSLNEKKNTIRSLMNIRMPGNASDELIQLQDKYLREELSVKGIVTLSDIPTIREQYNNQSPFAERISIWRGDITRLKVGAIVNAANSQLLGCFVPCHRCIDNAIHSAAGIQLRNECNNIMNQRRIQYGSQYEEPTGTATLTLGYNLPCDYVIHTVGPIVYGMLNDELCRQLRNCYKSVLKCCLDNKIKSVAFCCISTGEFRFPNYEAAQIAFETVTDFLKVNDSIERIIFNVFTDNDSEIYENMV